MACFKKSLAAVAHSGPMRSIVLHAMPARDKLRHGQSGPALAADLSPWRQSTALEAGAFHPIEFSLEIIDELNHICPERYFDSRRCRPVELSYRKQVCGLAQRIVHVLQAAALSKACQQ